jgi:hypothetical protein
MDEDEEGEDLFGSGIDKYGRFFLLPSEDVSAHDKLSQ